MVRIRRCQRCGPGSIPGWRSLIIFTIDYIINDSVAQSVERVPAASFGTNGFVLFIYYILLL